MNENKILEAQFKLNYEMYNDEIERKVNKAIKLLQEACELSEISGISINREINFVSGNPYTPRLMSDFHEIHDMIETEFDIETSSNWGWRHSELCY